jgi:nickel-dependent lactate racemase
MSRSLAYGVASKLELPQCDEPAEDAGRTPRADVVDVRRAVVDALQEPYEFPPLSQAIVEGDRVTIAVDRDVPQAGEIVAALVEHLGTCGIGSDHITVVYADAQSAAAARPQTARQTVPPTSQGAAGRPAIELHDPTDRGKLCFLGNTKSGRAIYLNRALGEADLLITLGTGRGRKSWAYRGPFGGIYPTFSDTDTQRRFRNPRLLDRRHDTFTKSQAEVESVSWQSGAQFTVQVVPGTGDEVATIVAGEINAVQRRINELHAARHGNQVVRSDVVVAALSGTAAQTWDGVALALTNVLDAVAEGGSVVLCTDLQQPLGPALELLARVGDDRDEALAHIARERPVDLFAAAQLADAQCRARVYLLSKLDPTIVEDLQMIPVGDPTDVGRLAGRAKSCLVVADAQHAVLDVAGNEL